jgi:hypothetical protein
LVEKVERFLRSSPRRDSYVLAELRQNWYYLRKSIESIEPQKLQPKSIPFRIIADYQRRLQSRTAIDWFFEEEEQLT